MTVISGMRTHAFVTGTDPSDSNSYPKLVLEAEFDDKKTRAVLPGFDGYERVFGLVPTRNNTTAWAGVAMKYTGTIERDGKKIDTYRGECILPNQHGYLPGGYKLMVDIDQARSLGVAFGFDSNVGQHWMQHAGQNTPVTSGY